LIEVGTIGRRDAFHGKVIRVFPERTKWTPTDGLAFVGEPPLWVYGDHPPYGPKATQLFNPQAVRKKRIDLRKVS
jgi:hypothetical protein